jgi:hypothetical protein
MANGQLDALRVPHFTRQRTQQPLLLEVERTVATLLTHCLRQGRQRCLLATQRNTAYRGIKSSINL